MILLLSGDGAIVDGLLFSKVHLYLSFSSSNSMAVISVPVRGHLYLSFSGFRSSSTWCLSGLPFSCADPMVR